jgi:hypothetical protein
MLICMQVNVTQKGEGFSDPDLHDIAEYGRGWKQRPRC